MSFCSLIPLDIIRRITISQQMMESVYATIKSYLKGSPDTRIDRSTLYEINRWINRFKKPDFKKRNERVVSGNFPFIKRIPRKNSEQYISANCIFYHLKAFIIIDGCLTLFEKWQNEETAGFIITLIPEYRIKWIILILSLLDL